MSSLYGCCGRSPHSRLSLQAQNLGLVELTDRGTFPTLSFRLSPTQHLLATAATSLRNRTWIPVFGHSIKGLQPGPKLAHLPTRISATIWQSRTMRLWLVRTHDRRRRSNMSDWEALFFIGCSILAGTVVPGPSFVVVTRVALSSRTRGVQAALGVAFTSMAFALLALAGLLAVLEQVPSMYLVLKVLGGMYLMYLGWKLWSSGSRETPVTPQGAQPKASSAFSLGLLTQASNPKAALVYASTFAAFLPADPSRVLPGALLVVIFALSAGWYSLVALAVSLPAVSSRYEASRQLVNRISAGLISALGLGIVMQSGLRALRAQPSG